MWKRIGAPRICALPSDAVKMELAAVGPPPESSGTQRPTQPSICGAFAKCTKYKKDSVRWTACTDAVTKYMCKEMVSFNTVEKKSFKELLATLDRQYDVPGRIYFSSTAIPHAYNSVRIELQRTLLSDPHNRLVVKRNNGTICHRQCILLTRIESWCQNASRRAFCQRTTPPLIWLMPCRMLCGSGN